MRLLFSMVTAVAALTACDRSAPAAKPAAKPAPVVLPAVTIGDVPAAPTMVLEQGMTLQTIAEKAYGNEQYANFVGRLNGIKDVTRIPAGKVLKTPSLAQAFKDAGIDPPYQPAINVLSKAAMDFEAALPAYMQARKDSRVGWEGKFSIPPDMQAQFTACANMLETAALSLSETTTEDLRPKSTLHKLTGAADGIRRLATGTVVVYDLETIHKDLGMGFTYALIWVQEDHHQNTSTTPGLTISNVP